MPPRIDHQPGLLVSVRSAEEALAALAGGADVIDVKEPAHGSLGAADASTIVAVVRAVAGRAPVTAAAGELVDLQRGNPQPLPSGVVLFKIGLAGCGSIADWPAHWREAVAQLAPGDAACERAVAVAYADWRAANAPDPADVLRLAVDVRAPALLVDTSDKSAGSLFDHWDAATIREWIRAARSHGKISVLAGSLIDQGIAAAANLKPDLVAVRTAACDAGRNGTVSCHRVAALRQCIASAAQRGPTEPTTNPDAGDDSSQLQLRRSAIESSRGAGKFS